MNGTTQVIAGAALLSLPFVVLTGIMARDVGLAAAAGIWALTVMVIGVFGVGIALLSAGLANQ